MLYAWNNPDVDPEFNLLKQWDRTYPAGGGTLTMPPSPAGAPVWKSLADVRTSRGYAANPAPEVL